MTGLTRRDTFASVWTRGGAGGKWWGSRPAPHETRYRGKKMRA
ncbi:hypothetical protein [Hyphomonas sp.]